jgi:hypothetical protein
MSCLLPDSDARCRVPVPLFSQALIRCLHGGFLLEPHDARPHATRVVEKVGRPGRLGSTTTEARGLKNRAFSAQQQRWQVEFGAESIGSPRPKSRRKLQISRDFAKLTWFVPQPGAVGYGKNVACRKRVGGQGGWGEWGGAGFWRPHSCCHSLIRPAASPPAKWWFRRSR